MRIFVTGATGFVGSALVEALVARGDTVVAMSRDRDKAAKLLPATVEIVADLASLSSCDAVVNLAGETVMGRWTESKKAAIRASRGLATERLAAAMLQCSKKLTLVHASAVGYYGDGDAAVDEEAPRGAGFLAEVCQEGEAAALTAAPAHRVVPLRIGVVLGRGGGVMKSMTPAFRAFVGGPVGSGKQWVSFIALSDLVRLVLFVLDHEACSGPINATAPQPVTMKQLTDAMGAVLGRPSWLPAPSFAIKALFGEAASAILGGQRVLPTKAERLGFRFELPTVEAALRAAI